MQKQALESNSVLVFQGLNAGERRRPQGENTVRWDDFQLFQV